MIETTFARSLQFWMLSLIACLLCVGSASADPLSGTFEGGIYRPQNLISIPQFEMTFLETGAVNWRILTDGWQAWDDVDLVAYKFPPVSGGTGTYSYLSGRQELTFSLDWSGDIAAKDDPDYHVTGIRFINQASFNVASGETFISGTLQIYTDGYYEGGDTWSNSNEGTVAVTFFNSDPGATPTPRLIVVDGTIQEAIDQASNGDVIEVPAGRYVENIDFKGKKIIVKSVDPEDSDIVAATIIDGNAQGPVVTLSGNAQTNCTLSGFTITNGKGTDGAGGIVGGENWGEHTSAFIVHNVVAGNEGGGISGCDGSIAKNTIKQNTGTLMGGVGYCGGYIGENHFVENQSPQGAAVYESTGSIILNRFERNQATGADGAFGGAVAFCFDVAIISNTFYQNSAEEGGAIFQCSGMISHNIFRANQATGAANAGGAIAWCEFTAFVNNVFCQNHSAGDGGAMAYCSGQISSNTIYGNSASNQGGGLHGCNTDGTIIENCIIFGNNASNGRNLSECVNTDYCCIDQTWPGTGNIRQYPEFRNLEACDFRLMKESPCIDAGGFSYTAYVDFTQAVRPINGSDEARGDGSDFDIGAYEYDPGNIQGTFDLVSLDRNVLYEQGKVTRFQVAVNPRGDFSSPVALGLPEYQAFLNHRFVPSTVTPPAIATLIVDLSDYGVWPGRNDLIVEAVSQAVESETKYLEMSFFAPDTTPGQASLFIDSSQFRIRYGGYTTIRGQLFPPMESELINIEANVMQLSKSSNGMAVSAIAPFATTDADGRFEYQFFPQSAGDYEIQATWSGNQTYPSVQSNYAYLEVVPKSSRMSLQVTSDPPFVLDGNLAFAGRVSPAPLGSATAEILVWYGYETGLASPMSLGVLDIDDGVFTGEVPLWSQGVTKIVARWEGDMESVGGAESPPIFVEVGLPTTASPGIDTALASSDPGHAIIVAGGTSENLSASIRDYLTNLSYSVLNQRRYSDARLLYVNNDGTQDVDWDGSDDAGVVDIVQSSPQAIGQALNAVKTYANPLSLFIVAEKGQGESLLMGDGSQLSVAQMEELLTGAVASDRDLRVFVEASNCGAFCEALSASNRTIIASASTEKASYFSNGLLSFSQLYFTQVQAGWGVEESFVRAQDYLHAAMGFFGAQTPLLIAGDDFNPEYLSFGLSSEAPDMLAPEIAGVFEPVLLEDAVDTEIFAYAYDDTALYAVEASLLKPDGTSTTIQLVEDASESGKYKATVSKDDLSKLGSYAITFQAVDTARNCSEPKVSQIVKLTSYDLNNDSKIDAADLYFMMQEITKEDSLFNIAGSPGMDHEDLYAFMLQWNP